jgi:hypothetical protein
MEGGMPETFEQLDELLVTLGASVERPTLEFTLPEVG